MVAESGRSAGIGAYKLKLGPRYRALSPEVSAYETDESDYGNRDCYWTT